MPHFLIQYVPKEGPSLRTQGDDYKAAQKARKEYRAALGTRIIIAGPVYRAGTDEDAICSIVIVAADDKAKAEALSREDPYYKAGEFSDVRVNELLITTFNPPAS